VIVEAVLPTMHPVEHAVIGEVPAETSEFARLTAAGFTVTPAVCVIPIALAVAEIVFACATVELKLAANCPNTSVEPDTGKLLPLPEDEIVTDAPWITLLY
jgi:hypothetical protein